MTRKMATVIEQPSTSNQPSQPGRAAKMNSHGAKKKRPMLSDLYSFSTHFSFWTKIPTPCPLTTRRGQILLGAARSPTGFSVPKGQISPKSLRSLNVRIQFPQRPLCGETSGGVLSTRVRFRPTTAAFNSVVKF